ncbi:hypothetical protein JCM16358_00560 [Halanaerocella petrolearia]
MKVISLFLNLSIFILVIIVILVVVSNMMFDRKVKSEVEKLFAKTNIGELEVITEEDLVGLPKPVKRWLRNSGVIGQEKIFTVRLKQKGFLRTEKEEPWMPAEAEQYFTIDQPAFIWKVKVKMHPLLYITGRDKYYKGKGKMLIKLLSLINVADSKGKEVDQGSLLRYLGEMVWFPTAALSSYVDWEEIDSNSARATMSYGEITASAVFKFNEKGEVENFTCQRYMVTDGKPTLETYSVPLGNYKELDGIRVPTEGRAIWKLKSGDFSYYKMEVTEVEYNNPVLY